MIWLLQYVASLVDVLRRPKLGLLGLLLFAAALAGFYGWLLLPVSSGLQVALNGVCALALMALIAVGLLLAYRSFDPDRGFLRSLRSPRVWVALPIAIFFGVWIPWLILDHVRFFDGFWTQVTVVALRFFAAALLMVTSVLWWLSVSAWTARNVIPEAKNNDEDVDPDQ
jgi:hypothetical protein